MVGGVILLGFGLIPLIGNFVMLVATITGVGAILTKGWAYRGQQVSPAR
jgi:hypothetical protein